MATSKQQFIPFTDFSHGMPVGAHRKPTTFLTVSRKWLSIVLIAATVIQLLIFPGYAQLPGCLSCLIGWSLCSKYVLLPISLKKYTLSSMVLIGFAFTQFWIPPVLTLIEGKPLVFNLNYPNSVFLHNFLAFLAMWGSFLVYTANLLHIRSYLARFFKTKTYLYSTPYPYQLWLMGILGVLGMSATRILGLGNDGAANTGILVKLVQGFQIYAYAPLFMMLSPLYTRKQYDTPKLLIAAYVCFLLAIGVLLNSRGAFMMGLTGLGLAYLLGLLLGTFSPRVFTLRNTIGLAVAFWVITGPLSDLGTAMVVTRSQRGEVSPTELLALTLDTYNNKELLNRYKSAAMDTKNNPLTDWDEYYFNNIFVARFSNLKFVDASLEHYYRLDSPEKNKLMFNYSIERTLAILPTPLLNFLGITIDKYGAIGTSYGDYLLALSTGNKAYLGGYRVGHFAGVGMAAFGWFYLLIMFVTLIPCFLLLDLLYYKGKFSIVSLIFLPEIFCHVGLLSGNIENPINFIPFLFRTWPQLVVLYLVLFYLTRQLRRFFI